MRLFIAAPIPETWHSWLARTQRALEQELPGYFRWTNPESWHLTVLFLGWQPAGRVDQLGVITAEVAATVAAPRLELGDLGAPPPPSRPRLVWIRCDDGGVLADAQRLLLSRLEVIGLDFDHRPFVGHITLGRARRPARIDFATALIEVQRRIRKPPDSERIGELVLFRSHLGPSGARYEALRRCQFRS